jgi:type II secretory pathway pseudopilin PulG
MTLLELMIAMTIMAIMCGVLGSLAITVQMQSQHSQSHGEAVQHARVALDRMQRAMTEATNSQSFPGFFVVYDTVSGYKLPDTIVVWRPTGKPANPSGLPLWKEVVVFGPDPDAPNRLLEVTNPGDARTVPALTDLSSWRTEVAAMKRANTATKTELTPLLRTADLSAGGTPNLRAALRFDTRLRPDDTQWSEYQLGTRTWENLDWVQSIYGTKTGLRQNWCCIELQLQPKSEVDLDITNSQSVLTFFGSAATYQKMVHQ